MTKKLCVSSSIIHPNPMAASSLCAWFRQTAPSCLMLLSPPWRKWAEMANQSWQWRSARALISSLKPDPAPRPNPARPVQSHIQTETWKSCHGDQTSLLQPSEMLSACVSWMSEIADTLFVLFDHYKPKHQVMNKTLTLNMARQLESAQL